MQRKKGAGWARSFFKYAAVGHTLQEFTDHEAGSLLLAAHRVSSVSDVPERPNCRKHRFDLVLQVRCSTH
jgi:hypothetical protein